MSNLYEESENGASLPNVEELKVDAGSPRSPTSTTRRSRTFWIIVVASVVFIAGVVTIFVSVGERRNYLKKTKSNASQEWNGDLGMVEPEHESVTVSPRGDSRLGDVMDFLSASITEAVTFEDKYSPQYKAARWLADQDFMILDIPDADPKDYSATYEFVQRYVMAVFYFSLGGSNWRYKSYFMSDYDVCDWNLLFQADEPPEGIEQNQWTFGIDCEDGQITDIMLTSNGLTGVIPAEIGDLLALRHLSLFDNGIKANFPNRMKALKNLQFLSLEQNSLSGSLPEWINEWTALIFLNLGSNNLDGQLPDLYGLDYLREVALDNNALTGPIDAFNQVPFLESIFLNDNDFSGFLGDETWGELSRLVSIDLSENELTGYVPEWVYALERADLHLNFLNNTGLPPVNIQDSPLEFLSVFGNDISGIIPPSLGNLASLTHLDLSDNFLSGFIPEDLFYLQDLFNLYLTDNDFDSWSIPDISGSTWIRELGLADCNLNGPIPQWLGEFTDLQLLDLRDNELTGPIPEELGQLYQLEWLMLNRNYLTGDVPAALGDLPNIITLFVDNNDLTGSLEPVCSAQPMQLTQMLGDCTVSCSCCEECCNPGDDDCNNWDETFRVSIEEERDNFVFSEDLIFNTGDQE